MFFKNSHYRKQPFTVTPDAQGFKSVFLRPTPVTDRDFLCTIEDRDCLDHLAYKYYKAPQKWGRIADANVDANFFSPIDLLGTGVLKSVRIPLELNAGEKEPPWSRLTARLSALAGVDSFRFAENMLLGEAAQSTAGESIPVATQSYERSVLVNYNSLTITVNELASAVSAAGFIAGRTESIGRTGRRIIIPPDGPA
jgi:hypothetical protein